MKKAVVFFVLIFNLSLFPQDADFVPPSYEVEVPAAEQNSKGWLLPSEGNIHALIIFAQFPDDNFWTDNADWPKGGAPASMNTWIDQTWSSSPTPYSLTDYFNQMSLEKLKFTGRAVNVITPHTRQYYLDNNKKRIDVHREIFQQLDQTMDFAEFDKWEYKGNYYHLNRPDGRIDFIAVVWRNISNEYPTDSIQNLIRNKLNFHKVASLGFPPTSTENILKIDNGARNINFSGTGATVIDWFREGMFRYVIHEFAHYLLGGNEYHNGFNAWAMLSGYGIRTFMVNAYEREKLGWADPVVIRKGTTQTVSENNLGDFITTGKAYKIEIDAATNQWFYVENHQKISRWDTFTKSEYPDDKGIIVWRQDRASSSDGMNANWMYIIPAEGRYTWTVNQLYKPSWYGGYLPVFKRIAANRDNGYHASEFVPYTYNGTNYPQSEIIFTEDNSGNPVQTERGKGYGKDAFRIGYSEVFSPWVNPNTQRKNRTVENLGIYLNSVNNGVYSISFYMNNPLEAPPSKTQNIVLSSSNNHPKITWDASPEPNISGYEIWTSDSEDPATFNPVATVPASQLYYIDTWTTLGKPYDYTTYYAVKAKNSYNKFSLLSNSIGTYTVRPPRKESEFGEEEIIAEETPNEYSIISYPNPFNPAAKIQFSLPTESRVTLEVYNILGERVSELLNEVRQAGTMEVQFNGASMPSGIYIYRFRAVSLEDGKHFEKINKMMLLK